jgi:hypothetical protein
VRLVEDVLSAASGGSGRSSGRRIDDDLAEATMASARARGGARERRGVAAAGACRRLGRGLKGDAAGSPGRARYGRRCVQAPDSGGVLAAASVGWAQMGSAQVGTGPRRLVDRVGRVCGLGQAGLWDRSATAAVLKNREH